MNEKKEKKEKKFFHEQTINVYINIVCGVISVCVVKKYGYSLKRNTKAGQIHLMVFDGLSFFKDDFRMISFELTIIVFV